MTLYAIHIEGPDDIIACVDLKEASEHAADINNGAGRYAARPEASPLDPVFRALVIEWPFSAEGHAEDVAEGDGRWES